ncbi:hypothetical protein [Roseofilum sp. Guam]|uniref:hypothetical protein n=1 Tax=Roseofilum sp. Guam TaxID=2821502 RepID=UPI001B20F09C|nr:hypothetical protein [Roseofilum sp. Guam]MBP0029574.1 hypothetical protein [Roseofilum sp. Guam]
MNTPKQVAPVERPLNLNASAISGQGTVEASGIMDDVLGAVKTVAPVVGPLLGSLI